MRLWDIRCTNDPGVMFACNMAGAGHAEPVALAGYLVAPPTYDVCPAPRGRPKTKTKRSPTSLNPYQRFVKQHFAAVASAHPDTPRDEIMRVVSALWVDRMAPPATEGTCRGCLHPGLAPAAGPPLLEEKVASEHH